VCIEKTNFRMIPCQCLLIFISLAQHTCLIFILLSF